MPTTAQTLDDLCINTIRFLSADAVQNANSGHPGMPMGAAAMTLGVSEYAIHGTNAPGSVGGFVSYGCIRMYNQDILDLFGRVSLGTPVIVTK